MEKEIILTKDILEKNGFYVYDAGESYRAIYAMVTNEVDEIDISLIINKNDSSYNNVQIHKSVNNHESSKKLLEANIDCTVNEINHIMKLFKINKIITL